MRDGELMTKFYHFTQSSRLQNILEQGLRPVDEEERNYVFPLGDDAPDNVVWLTAHRDTIPVHVVTDVCITVSLSPKNKRLHHWRTWLRKNMLDVFTAIENSPFDGEKIWDDFWFYEGTIAPDKFEAVEEIG